MGKRKQGTSANSIDTPSAINKRKRQDSKATQQSDSPDRERQSNSDAPSSSSSTSTVKTPIVSAHESNGAPGSRTSGGNIKTEEVSTIKAVTQTTVTTTTVAVSKPLPRIVVPSSLVPRQIARPKSTTATKKTSITVTGNHASLKTNSAAPSSLSSSNGSNPPAATREDVSTSTQSSRTVFRAKDIIQQWLPPLPDTLPLSAARRSAAARASTSYSTRATMGATGQTTTTTNTMIRADPIIVYSEKYPNRREYPYGNYPSYYETRIDEQTKDTKSHDHPASKPTSTVIPTPTKTTRSKANALSSSVLQVKAPASDQPFQTQQRGKPHRIWKATLSVLFPPGSLSAADPGDATADSGTSHPVMTLSELAKKVDIRFEFLDPSWFRGKRVLDIGCNSALLTIFIALHYKPCKIQGVDIDPSLIGKAQSFILKTFSQISPQAYRQTRHCEDTQDMITTTTTTMIKNDVPYEEHFPRALHKIHGLLPVPPRTPETEKLFPHNIELRVADWATETGNQQEAEGEQWDVVLAFSLTKWIHLHRGDTGLKAFFQKIYRSLASGGIMLLEPQAFETYNKRSKILPEMSATYKSIQFKPDQFQEYLLGPEVGFKEVVHLGHSEGSAKNFNRDIFLYRK